MWKTLHNIHPLIIFTLILVINIHFKEHHLSYLEQSFNQDLKFCLSCFEHQVPQCERLFQTIAYDEDEKLINFINYLLPKGSSKRCQHWLTLKNDIHTKIIAKELAQNFDRNEMSHYRNVSWVKDQFLAKEDLNGLQFCPKQKIDRFAQRFQGTKDELTVWLYILVNIQPILFPVLEELHFPVPKTHGVCGFTLYQSNAGKSLSHFYEHDFPVKLRISKLLLEAAIKFSHGFDGFRLYITDMISDNIVYDKKQNKLFFIDLDTIFVVDSTFEGLKTSVHRQDYLECSNCFAFSPTDLCDHILSDVNIFQVCQLLREDLNRNHQKGFLYPIPVEIFKTYPKLSKLLKQCVECPPPECKQRFPIALELIAQIELLLNDIHNNNNLFI